MSATHRSTKDESSCVDGLVVYDELERGNIERREVVPNGAKRNHSAIGCD